MEEKNKERDIAILMQANCSREEAEEYLEYGTEIYENPEEYIQMLNDHGCEAGLTVEQIRNGELRPHTVIVAYENHEYLIDYTFDDHSALEYMDWKKLSDIIPPANNRYDNIAEDLIPDYSEIGRIARIQYRQSKLVLFRCDLFKDLYQTLNGEVRSKYRLGYILFETINEQGKGNNEHLAVVRILDNDNNFAERSVHGTGLFKTVSGESCDIEWLDLDELC